MSPAFNLRDFIALLNLASTWQSVIGGMEKRVVTIFGLYNPQDFFFVMISPYPFGEEGFVLHLYREKKRSRPPIFVGRFVIFH